MKIKGLMATSHVLVSLCLLLLVMMLPIDFFQMYFYGLLKNPIVMFFTVIIFIGMTLLVDLDNHVSKAGSELGIIGDIVTVFMQSTSGLVWGIFHFRGDRPPMTQHRYLWHTPFIFFVLFFTFYFGLPEGNSNILTTIVNETRNQPILEVVSRNGIILLFMFVSFSATLVGSTLVLTFLKKFIKIDKWYKYVLSIIVISYLLLVDLSTIKHIAIVSSFGYLFHIIGDAFCDSGIPLLFPIPLGSQVWKKIKLFPITITTGGNSNKIVDLIATVLLPILFIYILGIGK